jgi:hypothetical protein
MSKWARARRGVSRGWVDEEGVTSSAAIGLGERMQKETMGSLSPSLCFISPRLQCIDRAIARVVLIRKAVVVGRRIVITIRV